MNRQACGSACALLGVTLSACQSLPTVDGNVEAAKIRALDAAWVAAIAGGDPARVVPFYSDDALLLPPNEDALNGEAIRHSWAEMLAMPKVHLEFAPTRIEVAADGEMAIDVGTYQFSFQGPAGKVEDHGKYAQVWEKKDGVWKCAVDMYNSSVPLPAPAAVPAAHHKKKKN